MGPATADEVESMDAAIVGDDGAHDGLASGRAARRWAVVHLPAAALRFA